MSVAREEVFGPVFTMSLTYDDMDDAGSVSVAEEFQRLRHEQVVVLEDAAVAGVRVDAELSAGQHPGEVERAARRQHRVVVAVDDQDGLVHVRQACGRGALFPLREGGDLGADRLVGHRCVAVLGALVQTGEEGVGGSLAGRGRREEQEVLGVLALAGRLLQGSLEYGPVAAGPGSPAGAVPARMTRRTKSGRCWTMTWATMPPREKPSRSTVLSSSACRNAIASPVMASMLSGVVPPEPPTPRRSTRMTRRSAAMPSTTAGSQSSSTAVKWCRNTTGIPVAGPPRGRRTGSPRPARSW